MLQAIIKKFNAAYLLSISFLALWIILSAQLNQAQFGDNLEQFNWAHHAEWGYWKHPPFTTWLLIGLQSLIGFHELNTYVLSFICLAITLYFYQRLADLFVSKPLADLSILLLSASFMFTWRAQMFNHNTSLTMMTAILAWQFFAVTKKSNITISDWLCLSITSAITLLAKYQSIVLFLGLLLAFYLQKKLTKPKIFYGLCICLLATFILLLPHLYWISQNTFLIMEYTTDRFEAIDFSILKRFKNLASFFIQQIRFFILPLIIFFVYRSYLGRSSLKRLPISFRGIYQKHHAWLWGLFLLPLFALLGLSVIGGVKLQNHWGMASFLFLPLILVLTFPQPQKANQRFLFTSYCLFQILSMLIFFFMKTHFEVTSFKRADTMYPGSMMAQTILADWKKETSCPLKIISGPAFEAGIVSVYSGPYPAVLEEGDFHKTPWLNQDKINTLGMIVLSNTLNESPKKNMHSFSSHVVAAYPFFKNVHWEIIPPSKQCIYP